MYFFSPIYLPYLLRHCVFCLYDLVFSRIFTLSSLSSSSTCVPGLTLPSFSAGSGPATLSSKITHPKDDFHRLLPWRQFSKGLPSYPPTPKINLHLRSPKRHILPQHLIFNTTFRASSDNCQLPPIHSL